MKTSYILFALIIFLSSCNTGNNKSKAPTVNSSKALHNTDSEKTKSNNQHTLFKIPVLGTFDLTAMKTDSTNHYNFEDCIGKTVHYSDKNSSLTADSLTCKEDIYIYTYYLFNNKNNLMAVSTKKLGMTLVPGQQTYSFVLTEKVYDFNSNPPALWEGSDTLETALSKPVNLHLSKKVMKNREGTLKLWNMKYSGLWRLK